MKLVYYVFRKYKVIQNSMYKLLVKVENTKTKQNRIGIYDRKLQPDQLVNKERGRNDKRIISEKALSDILH